MIKAASKHHHPKITFIEVDTEDTSLVIDRFPTCLILSNTLQNDGVLQRCNDTEVLSCFIYSKIGKKEIVNMPNLKLICTRSVGYDHIDVHACKERGIVVCNVPDYGSHVIAEHVFALLLSTIRHIPEADLQVERGGFDYHGLRGMALLGKTLGIVGTGKIGRRVARIGHGFGMRLIATDQCRTTELTDLMGLQYVSYENLLETSDIITLHVPVTNTTRHMVDKKAFDTMKDGVILINTARGALIDSTSLVRSLKSGKVSYALLDVLEHEKNFEESKDLIMHPNVVTTPHIAFYADDSMRNMCVDSIRSIEQWISGKEPEHIVKPQNIVCDLQGIH